MKNVYAVAKGSPDYSGPPWVVVRIYDDEDTAINWAKQHGGYGYSEVRTFDTETGQQVEVNTLSDSAD